MKSSIYYGLFLFSLFIVVSTLQLGKSRITYNAVQQQRQAAEQNTPQLRRGEVSIVTQMQQPLLFPAEMLNETPAVAPDSLDAHLPVHGE